MYSGLPASGDVRENALAKSALPKCRVGLLLVQLEPPRHREQILMREVIAPGEQQGMRLPELSVDRGELRELRGEVRTRVQFGIWKMPPNQAQGVEPIQEGLHRPAGGEAERTAEVAVLDQGQLRARRSP